MRRESNEYNVWKIGTATFRSGPAVTSLDSVEAEVLEAYKGDLGLRHSFDQEYLAEGE